MLIATLAAASITLASCATMPTPAQVAPQVERAQAAYDRIASTVEIILPATDRLLDPRTILGLPRSTMRSTASLQR
jgi:hypothetical protein